MAPMQGRSLRVLHVVASAERRGAEIFAADLVRALAEVGIDQRVAILRAGGPVAFDAPTVALPAGRSLPGVRVAAEPLRAVRRLARQADVVQAHGGEPFKVAALAGGGAPIVYRKIGLARPWIRSRSRRAAYALLMRRASRVVAVAEEVRRELVEDFGVPSGRVALIPNARDRRLFDPEAANGRREELRRALGIPEGASAVISVTALTPEKDPLGHLRVVDLVSRRLPTTRYLLVGDGPMRSAVERAAGSRNGIRLLGSRPEVPQLLAASDALLLASTSEGMPACLIEAGLAGLPSAAYAVGGVREVLVDGETGLLAPPGDAEALAGRVVDLLSDPARGRAMGRAARERCLVRFEVGPVARSYLRLYRDAIAGPAARSAG
jgi:glycosyltransferase involved in cell wall biosynthesis